MLTMLLICALLMGTSFSHASSDLPVSEIMLLRSSAAEKDAELRTNLIARAGELNYLKQIPAEDIQFLVDDIPLPIKEAPVGDQRIGFIFVVDRSRYHSSRIPFENATGVMTAAIGAMGAQDQCAFVVVDSGVSVISFGDKTSALSVASSFTQSTDAKGDNVLVDGISQAIDMARLPGDGLTQKMIVIITDGEDQGSTTTLDMLKEKLAASPEIPVSAAILFYSKFRPSNNERKDRLAAQRTALVDLCSGTKSIYALIDSAGQDAQQSAEGMGRRIASFGDAVMTATLDLTPLASKDAKDGPYSLEVRYTGGSRALIAKASINLLASMIPVPAPDPTPTSDPMLFTKGEENQDVRFVQRRLKELYYYQGEPSGICDEETQMALDDFYERNQIPLHDGMSLEAFEVLKSGGAIAAPTQTPEPEATRDPNLKFAIGESGAEVREAKALLTKYGYYKVTDEVIENPETFGTFDEWMLLATDAFCRENGLELLDEGMSMKAWVLLNSDKVVPAPTPTPTPGPSRDPNVKIVYGETGPLVRELQDRLEALYYYAPDPGAPYGTLNDGLLKAINQFARDNKLDTVNGISIDTWKLLMEGTPTPKATEVPQSEYMDLKPGDNNELVNDYQIRLKALQYYEGDFTPGLFDEATQKAQDRLCEVNGYSPEIGASVKLQKMVFSEGTKENEKPDFVTDIKNKLLSETELFGRQLPVWVLALVGAILLLGVLIAVGVMLSSRGRERRRKPAAQPAPSPIQHVIDPSPAPEVYTNQEPKTEAADDMDGAILTGDEPPTVNVDSWQLALRIEYQGISHDYSYTMDGERPLTVGRAANANVRLDAEDLKASRQHGSFYYRNSVLYYQDDSSHGTIINGELVHQAEYKVPSGCVIQIGAHRIKVDVR